MALCRSFRTLSQRSHIVFMAVRASGGTPPAMVDPHKGKTESDTVTMPDTLGHAVGAERYELLSKLAGNEDPFEMNLRKMAAGTLAEPNLIPSMVGSRVVGCICEEDATSINWMNLYQGEPKRCECGYWFKLTEMKDYNV